jgi:hypothetical protein
VIVRRVLAVFVFVLGRRRGVRQVRGRLFRYSDRRDVSNAINVNHNRVLGGSKLNEFIFQYADFGNTTASRSSAPNRPAGLIIPHVNSPEDAARAAAAAKYPPLGSRSIGVARAQDYGLVIKSSLDKDNQDTALIAQIEHIDAVRAIEAILEVAGVDAAFIGPFDLSGSLGKPGRLEDFEIRKAVNDVRSACAEKKRPVGIFTADLEAASALTIRFRCVMRCPS